MFQSKWAYIGFFIILIFLICALMAPILAPYSPHTISLPEQLQGPSFKHPFGQDSDGCDILSRLIYGIRISLLVSILVVLLSGSMGIFIGLVSGYYGGFIDIILMRIVDILLAFPGLLLAIGLVAVLGPSLFNVITALTILGWVSYARLVRGQVLSVKEREYIFAAKTSGQSDMRIMLRHILPNVISPVIVQATFSMAGVIIAEASLSFLGLGVAPGTPSLGAMLSQGKNVLWEAPHVSIFPGATIMIIVLAFNFLGDGLRDQLDPKAQKNE